MCAWFLGDGGTELRSGMEVCSVSGSWKKNGGWRVWEKRWTFDSGINVIGTPRTRGCVSSMTGWSVDPVGNHGRRPKTGRRQPLTYFVAMAMPMASTTMINSVRPGDDARTFVCPTVRRLWWWWLLRYRAPPPKACGRPLRAHTSATTHRSA